MQESLPPEHGGELFADALEELLGRRRVADEGGGHLETAGRDVAHGRLHVVGDPFDEVGGVLVLDVEHLFVHFLHAHATAEHSSHRQISAEVMS